MKSLSHSELAEMLRNNPDLAVDGDIAPPSKSMPSKLPSPFDVFAEVNSSRNSNSSLPKLTEHDFQSAVIAKCDERSILRPEWGLIFAIPNGQYRQGQRMEPGLRPGVLDLFLPVARHGYHGCFIELKISPNKETDNQVVWRQHLTAEGYLCRVFWDIIDEVVGFIEWYLEGA